MSIVPLPGSTSASLFVDPSYTAGEQLNSYVGRLHRATGRTPVLYFHGYQQRPADLQAQLYQPQINAAASTSYPVIVADLGGGSQWATPDVVDVGGHVDDALDYAAGNTDIGTRADKVAVFALGMGTLNALNWAWRHPGRVRSVVLIGPIVDAEKFYDDNPTFQAAINTDWGSQAAFDAALPTIDPMRNLDLIRPFGHRIQLWYAADDEYIDGADVEAFAELVGAEAIEFPGTHVDLPAAPADRAAMFTLQQIRDRARAYTGWDNSDLTRFTEVPVSLPVVPGNTNLLRTTVGVDGRRAEFVRVAGTEGNERHAQLLNDFSAPDMAVRTVWHNGEGRLQVGQLGNVMRAVIDADAGTYLMYVAWSNVLFFVPWIINRAVWSGTVGGNNLVLLGGTNSTIAGLRLSAGGEVLASERQGNTVTLICREEDLDANYRTGVVEVLLDDPTLADFSGLAVRVNHNRLQYTQTGADVTSGGPGSWADFGSCYPYVADTELVDRTMRGRFYPPGMDAPDWDDPDWSFTWTDVAGHGPAGYGQAGWLANHVGIFVPNEPNVAVGVGAFVAEEL